MRHLVTSVSLVLLGAGALFADKADSFFDGSAVREIRLTFDDANWYQTLYQAHSSNSEDPYFPARFQCGDVVIEKIGARFKGNASFRRSSSVKKSFKLDFKAYDGTAKFLGLKKLNLNNGDLQPDFMREKLFLDLASQYIAASRVAHVRLYVNDALYGLYLAVEQPDKTMMESRFGDSEDGNLYEAGESNATMSYLGTDAGAYQKVYELKTNETANDYSGLINFLDILNNTAAADLPAKLEPVCDVENMLYGIALDILFVNLDSYVGSGSEYYLYQRSDTGQFVRVHWDLNESFGTTGDGSPSVASPVKLDPFYMPTTTTTGGGAGGRGGMPGGTTAGATSARPLMEKLWAVDSYKRLYLQMLARMLREGFNSTAMEARIKTIADLIRTDVYADPNKLYTSTDFENSLTSSVRAGQITLQGLTPFVSDRYTYLRSTLDTYAQPSDIRLNEVMSLNSGASTDETGEADPWVEIHNLGPGTVNLSGLYLTDDTSNPTKWALPSRKLADGEFLVLWMDGETGEGETHSSLSLSSAGGKLYLYNGAGGVNALLDSVEYPELSASKSYMRSGIAGTKWAKTDAPTPGAVNVKE